MGLRAYSMTPGATWLSKLVGCALSLSVFSLWQSPHSACKICTLPAKACLTGTTWSSSQVPAVSPQPHSARLPSCAARVFCLSAAPGTSRFASARCAARRTLASPRRRCRGASSRGAAWRQSRRTPPPRSAAAARPAAGAERLILEGALQHVLLVGQLEAHAPQAPHALAQERLHLRPGVPVVRALGADHPVPLRVEEVGLVQELQDGS